MTERQFNWEYFGGTMAQLARQGEREWASLLGYVELADDLVGRLVARETSPESDRPQDYVACILVVRSFRLTVATISLALAGYSDACPNLYRTVWEITVRLLDMSNHPVEAALGYLLQGTFEELSAAQVELEHATSEGSDLVNLPSNIAALETHYARLKGIAEAQGLHPTAVQRKHGRLNYRNVCEQFGIEKAYLVNYAFASGYVHEKNWATGDYVSSSQGERQFELGPNQGPRQEAIADSLRNLLVAVNVAAIVVMDEALKSESERALADLERDPAWPRQTGPSSA